MQPIARRTNCSRDLAKTFSCQALLPTDSVVHDVFLSQAACQMLSRGPCRHRNRKVRALAWLIRCGVWNMQGSRPLKLRERSLRAWPQSHNLLSGSKWVGMAFLSFSAFSKLLVSTRSRNWFLKFVKRRSAKPRERCPRIPQPLLHPLHIPRIRNNALQIHCAGTAGVRLARTFLQRVVA